MSLDVVGVGNAIMDALVRIPDEGVLDELGLARGRMTPWQRRRHRWRRSIAKRMPRWLGRTPS